MILKVKPVDSIKGRIALPASKSYSIRAFIVAACGGSSTIIQPSDCDDAIVSMQTASALGAKVKGKKSRFDIDARKIKSQKSLNISVGESGTALRFLLPLCSTYVDKATLKGKGTLVGRPNQHLNQTLRSVGLNIKGAGRKESVPIKYLGGKIERSKLMIDGSLSSQFISALLITAGRLPQDVTIHITGRKMVSVEYITMTQQILAKAGIRVRRVSPRELKVKGGQKFKGLKNFTVPSDYGLAAFFLAAGALVKSDLTLTGSLKDDLIQSDGAILPLLKKMGVRFVKTSRSLKIKGPFQLKGGTFSLKDCPDLVPIMAVTAMFAKGVTRLTDIAHARVKESDRISDLRRELLKVGADIRETKNSLSIHPKSTYKAGVQLDSHKDHRLAMAFAVLGLKVGVAVKDADSCAKSYPGFIRDFQRVLR